MAGRTIYIGKLPLDTEVWEIEDLFRQFGHILDIKLRLRHHPPAHCFVEYKQHLGAQHAIMDRDGFHFRSHCIRVKLAYVGVPLRGAYHSMFQVLVLGLPSSASWEELKEHMQLAGDVCFANIQFNRDKKRLEGTVHYTNDDDMQRAIRELDRSKFLNRFYIGYTITVERYDIRSQEEQNRHRNRRSRSPPARLSRSRSRSRQRLRSTVVLRPRSRS